MEEQKFENGGFQYVPQIAQAVQYVYLDFDGESTSYNGEILTINNVDVKDSSLPEERIEKIVSTLNTLYAQNNIVFVTKKPTIEEYSTIYIGKTNAFSSYGNFAGLAETIDTDNNNNSDNAFVLLDYTASDEQIISTICHETNHLLGTLDHGGEGLNAYADNITVGNGVISSGLVITNKNSVTVSNGGTANNTKINLSGYMYISNGGTANNTTINSRGFMYIYNGGIANNTTLNFSGYMHISSGGTANSTTINNNGSMRIYSGGTANSTTINNNGSMRIYSGGIANNTTVNSNTDMDIVGIANNTTLNSSGYMHISSGGTANSTTINNNGSMRIHSGGIANNTTVNSNADMCIYGIANNTTLNSSGYMYIYSGGTANSTTINNNGSMRIYSGGTANNTTVNSNTDMDIYGIANNVTVNANGIIKISSGGTANNTTVNSGGNISISSGGTATEIIENGGYVYIEDGASATFASNTINGLTISNQMTVHQNTVANNITVTTYGSMFIYSGGLTNSTAVISSGYLYVYSGGTATNVIWTPCVGEIIAEGGAYVTYASTYSGVYFGSNNQLLSRADSMQATVTNNCSMYVMSNGLANSTTVYSNGYMYIDSGGTAINTTVNRGGYMHIYSGGTANNTTIKPSGYMYISNGGTANNTTINSSEYIHIYSGGTANAIIENGGYVLIDDGASVTFASNTIDELTIFDRMTVHQNTIANSTTIDSNGSMLIYNSGLANNTTVNSRGFMFISSGGTANNTTVNSWGSMRIDQCGIANNITVNPCGQIAIYSGGTATTIVENGGYVWLEDGANVTFASNTIDGLTISRQMTVHQNTIINNATINALTEIFSGGIANNNNLNGIMNIRSGGTANKTIVNQYGSIYILDGGIANNTTLNSSGYMYISSGGTANITTINNNGGMRINSGGTANNTTVNSNADMDIYGIANNVTVNANGIIKISSGGTANNTIANSRSDIYVNSGGTANNTTVNSGGNISISSGGTATEIIENGGYVYIQDGASATFASNTINGLTISNQMTVHQNTVANNITVTTYGSMFIYSGGLTNSTAVISSGYLYVYSGGTATNVIWTPCVGEIIAEGGAYVTYASTYSGVYFGSNNQLLSRADSMQDTVANSCSMYVMSNGLANNTTLNGGNTYFDKCKMYIYNGGTAINTTVNHGGYMCIYSAGKANNTTVNSGGSILISSGGTATEIVENGGYVSIAEGANVTIASNTINNLTVSRGMTIHQNTVANSITVRYDGCIYIYSGGKANNTTVSYGGGNMYVYNGGLANSTTVINVSAYMYIYSGGTANNNEVTYNGNIYISNGGIASNTTVTNYGEIFISSGGLANSTTVDSNGYMYIYSGGTATNIIWTPCVGEIIAEDGAYVTYANTYSGVYLGSNNQQLSHTNSMSNKKTNGCSMYIMSDGLVNETTVNSSGYMYVYNGGTANNTTVDYSGKMYIYSGGIHSGSLQIEGGAVVSAYKNSIIDFTIADRTAENDYLINNLSLISGAPTYTITVSSNQEFGTYKLAQNASNFNGSITIGDEATQYGTITVNGDTLIYGKYQYTLIQNNNNLTLDIVENHVVFVYSSGTLTSSGGIITGATLASGGNNSMHISSGGTAYNTNVNKNGYMHISNGGVANETTVNSGGIINISSGGIVNDATVSSAGIINIYSRGITSDTIVSSGGTINVNTYGKAIDVTIAKGGRINAEGDFANVCNVTVKGELIARSKYSFVTDAEIYGTVSIYSAQIENAIIHKGGSLVFNFASTNVNSNHMNGNITVAGQICVAYNTLGTRNITFDLTQRTSQDDVLITNLSNLSGQTTYFVKLSNSQEFGTYKLADDASSFSGSISIGNGTIQYGSINIGGGIFNYNNVDYKLSNTGGNLNLHVGDFTPPDAPIAVANITTLTNQDVLITVDYSNNSTIKQYRIGNSEEWLDYSDTFAVTDNATIYFRAEDAAGNEITSQLVIDYIDKIAPTLDISGNATEWTNKDVTLTANASDGTIEFFSGESWVKGNTIIATKNGTYTFRVTDAANNITEKSVIVDKIDKDAPALVISGNATEWTNKDVTLTASATDSCCVTIYYKKLGDSEFTKYDNAIVSTQNDTYIFYAVDGLGNVSAEQTIVVDKIDKVTPTLDITGNATTWTNKDVTLTASCDEGVIEFFNGESWVEGNSITATENGDYAFRVTDKANNVTEKTIVVDKIDKIAPTLDISGNATNWTNKDVVLTASCDEGVIEFFNGESWVEGNSITATKNGNYTFRVTDKANNVTEKTIVVDKIDKDAPALVISGNATEWTNKDVTLTASASDACGVTIYYKKLGDSEFTKYDNAIVSPQNDTYIFYAVDSLGNVSAEQTIVINKIDKVAPTLDISGNATTWTNQDVVLTASCDEGVIEFFNGESWVEGNTITATKNGNYTFRVTDKANNVTEKTIVVDKIDKVAPTLNITGNATAWTNKNVTLTANVSDGVVEFFNGTNWVDGATQTVSDNGTYTFKVTDAAGNVTIKDVEVSFIDKIAPTLDITGNATTWTNKDITLTANVSDGKVEFFNGTNWVDGATQTVTDNGTYTFKVSDEAGNVTIKDVEVSFIDKVAPTLNITGNATTWTNKDVTLTANVSDGVVEFFNGINWVTGSTQTVTENGTYTFKVTDEVGNVTTKDVEVSFIDKVAPTLDITGNATAWTNKDVVLTASCDEGVIEFFNGESWVEGNSITATKNGNYTFRVTDKANNVTEKTIVVDKIDKVAPTLDIAGNATTWTNKDVTLTANVSDGIVEFFNGTNWVDGATQTVSDNGTYTFKVTDAAGNVTIKDVEVSFIDKIAPTLDITGNATTWTNKDVTLTANVSDGKVEFFNGTNLVDGATQTVSANGTYTFKVTDAAGNVTIKDVEVSFIDKVAPTLDITGNATTWTNKDVILTANVSDGIVEFFNGNTWVTGAIHTVSDNGTYTFKVTDAAGNVTTKDVEVTFIDKVAPTLDITGNATAWTNKDVVLTASCDEGVIEFFNGESWVEGNTITATKNGNYTFRVTDKANNVTEKTIVVDKIDKIAPTLDITSNATAWTNKDVTLTANVSDGVVEFFNGTNWVDGATQTVSDNGTYTFKVTDAAGNVTIKDVEVSFIDKIAPTLDITGNATTWTNKDVTLTANVSDGKVEFFNGKNWVDGSTQTVSANGTYTFKVTDEAGNVTIKDVEVSFIDKVAPTLNITGNPTNWTNKDVTLSASANEDSIIEFFNGTNWVTGSTHTISANGTYTFKVTDKAGNVTIKDVIVDKVDKTNPLFDIKTDAKIWSNQDVTIKANVNENGCTIQYQIDNGSWQQYSKNVVVSENCTVNFKVTDKAGNIVTKSVTIDSIDESADSLDSTTVIFISSKYNEKTTGKKQDSIVLSYGENAFSTIEDALAKYPDFANNLVVIVDSKTDSTESINLPVVAATTVTPTIKETDNSYSYKATSQAKNSITITKDTGNTEFIRFATVDVNGGDVETIIGGKLTNSKETATIVDKKGTVTTTDKFTNTTNATGKFTATNNATIENVENYSTVNLIDATIENVTAGNTKVNISSKIVDAYDKYQKTISCVDDKVAVGSITLTDGANASEINAFANVTLNNATAGNINNFTSKASKSETTTFDEGKKTVTRKVTLSHTENTAGTLKATNVESLGDVTGFATVTLTNVNDAGDFKRVDENGNKYSTVKETLDVKTNKDKTVTGKYTKTETFTRNGKLTATNSNIGDIANYSTVTLDGTTANNISNFQEAKIVTTGTASWKNMDVYSRPNDYDLTLEDFDLIVTTTKSLNGSVTLKNNAKVENIINYQTVTLSNSTANFISNVNKVSISKGKSIITSYKGTDENDTLSIAKDAVLIAQSINLGLEAKDTINLAGTIILTGREFVATNITGKGEIVATSDVYKKLDINFANVLDIGETAENFKGTTFENSDNALKKAAKWDPANQYDGWMGSWSGTKEGSDEVDFITFKANAGDTLVITNIENSNWTLFDKKGNEIVDVSIFNNNTFLSSGEYILKLENNEDKSISYSVKLA